MDIETGLISKKRIVSIDMLRGLIMLIMAIDHIRDMFLLGQPDPTDLATTTSLLFFTRWITHFCAPIFVFLSGISANLAGQRRSKGALSAFLIKRGMSLVIIEFVLVSFAITLDPLYHLLIFQVIWAIGASMVLLGLLVWLPLPVIGLIGLLIFFGHNIPDIVSVGPVIVKSFEWKLLVSSTGFQMIWPISPGRNLLLVYALLPWTGVMLLGYVAGSLYRKAADAAVRQTTLLQAGLLLLVLFFTLRALNLYGDPAPWSFQKTSYLSIVSFLNVTKYPCSLIYLCMTLFPALLFLSCTEALRNRFSAFLIVYGKVPLFYYLCHWYLIRLLTVINYTAGGVQLSRLAGHPGPPPGYGYSLGAIYLIWIFVITLLYFPCRWYGRYKSTHSDWWLSYL